MIDYETYVQIRNYYKNENLKYSQIADALNLDIRTVAKWANEERYRQRDTVGAYRKGTNMEELRAHSF